MYKQVMSARRKSRHESNEQSFSESASYKMPPDFVTTGGYNMKPAIIECLRTVYSYTIASCLYSICCFELTSRAQKLTGDETDSEYELITKDEDSRIKRKLLFHFMNPFQKWKHKPRRRFPWKFLLQLLSIIVVTTQVCLFAESKFKLTYYLTENKDTFSNIFMRPECGKPQDTIYTLDQLCAQINHTVYSYYMLPVTAVGPYDVHGPDDVYPPGTSHEDYKLKVYIARYRVAEVYAHNKSYNFSNGMETIDISLFMVNTSGCEDHLSTECTKNLSTPCCAMQCCNHTVMDQVQSYINEETLDGIITISFQFSVDSIFLDVKSNPVCVQFYITVAASNNVFSGNMPVEVTVKPELSKCNPNLFSGDVDLENRESNYIPLDLAVIIIVLLSSATYVRSLMQSFMLAKEVRLHFRDHHKKRLRWKEIGPLYNSWFLLMLFANVLIIAASILKIIIGYQVIISITMVDLCSILLGLGVFFQWCGLLRFLSYFETYNILLITLRLAMPSVLRFAICTLIFYTAFLLCGWLVLGPYHPKFRNLYISSETLFSLLNGDDMYNTYELMSSVSISVWIFSKIYLYIFISLFIYVVLSLFIGLIGETYETLTELWKRRSQGYLRDFAEEELVLAPSSDLPFPLPRVRAHSPSSDDETCHHNHHHDTFHHTHSHRHQSVSDNRPNSAIIVTVEEPPPCDTKNKRYLHPLQSSTGSNTGNRYYGSTNYEQNSRTSLYPRLDTEAQLQELAASTADDD